MRRQFTYKKIIVAFLLVAASVTLMNLTGKPENGPSFWESLLLKSAEPVSRLSSGLFEKYRSLAVAFQDKEALRQENLRLTRELEGMASLRAALEDALQENARLRDLLDFRDDAPGEYVVAKVTGRNPGKWFATVTIAAGEEHGVYVDAPVVSRSGLVGRVIKTGEASSTVLLIADPESGVGACVQRTRDFGVLLGGNGPDALVLRFFSRDSGVEEGDAVVTSGIGSKFPEGILVGEVVSVYIPGPGLVKEALVRPASDLERLEEVLVMTR